MVNIIKEEILLEESLKRKIEFAKVQPTIINGSIRKIDKTNLTYIEPHRIIINDINFLAFNYSNEIFIVNLKIQNSEIKKYLLSIIKALEFLVGSYFLLFPLFKRSRALFF